MDYGAAGNAQQCRSSDGKAVH